MTENRTSQAVAKLKANGFTGIPKTYAELEAISQKYQKMEDGWNAISVNPSTPPWLKQLADEMLAFNPLYGDSSH